MKIHSLMFPNPITITGKSTIEEAISQMKTNSIRHLPVISKSGKLKGLVTLADLKQGLIPSMLSDISLADIMVKKPITVGPMMMSKLPPNSSTSIKSAVSPW